LKPSGIRDWIKAFRVHQWLKNLLVFVPLLASHRYTELPLLQTALLAFLAFSLCASSAYILNDLLDAADDRLHPTKRFRPFASGRLSIRSGAIVFPLLLVGVFAAALAFTPIRFVGILSVYYALTLAYSMQLKRRMVFDVISLAALYTLRVIAGAAAVGVPLSFWLLALSMFMFLSLALVKRYAELFQLRTAGAEEKARGRGYYSSDLEMLASLGASSGYMSVMVLALYINDANTAHLYEHIEVIWLACPLLLTWITRMWMMTHRGFMNDDPVVFAVRDRISLILGVLVAAVFWLAT
jgi:4-hydroxybenzoate polyprenyltransferase